MIAVLLTVYIPPNVVFKEDFWLSIIIIFRQINTSKATFGDLQG
jgi:hypothetical protein